MSETYYVSPMNGGGFSVQRVQDGLEDFYSYHRTREEAEASIVNARKRAAADELYDALVDALKVIADENYSDESYAAFQKAQATLAKARGEVTA